MIICVNNNKGGVLKTTTVTNLAGALAVQGKKVLIVDCDNQSNVALSFGRNPDKYEVTLYDVLSYGLSTDRVIDSVHPMIDIIPSNNDLTSFEFEVIGDKDEYPEPFSILKNALEHLRDKYDYILIDTPPSLGLMNGNVFAFADTVLIPYQPEPYSMRSLKNVVKTIGIFKEQYNPNLEILGIVKTLVHPTSNLHADVIKESNQYAYENDIHMFETVIPRTVQFASAVGYNQTPQTLLKKKDKGSLYFDLLEEIKTKLKGSV